LGDLSEGDVADPVLHRLFKMGIYDWRVPDVNTEAEVNANRYTACITSRLFQQIMALEKKVRCLLPHSWFEEVDNASRITP
jgi:hypothetical protein